MLERFSRLSKTFITAGILCLVLMGSESAWAMQVGSAAVSASNVDQAQASEPVVAELKISGGLRYLSSQKAELRWVSNLPGESTVAYGSDRKLGTFVKSTSRGVSHSVVLTGLEPGQELYYRVAVQHESGRKLSGYFVVESGMNYRLPKVTPRTALPFPDASRFLDDLLQAELSKLGGVVVLEAAIAEDYLGALLKKQNLTVIVAFDDDQTLRGFRQDWYQSGLYGVHLSAQLARDLPDEFANLVLVDGVGVEESLQWLSPSGQILCHAESDPGVLKYRSRSVKWSQHEGDLWLGSHGSIETLSKWDHQYGSAANTSFVGESLEGVDRTDDLEVKWLGRPGADFGIDRNPRMPAPLVVGGRLFHQGMNRMVAVDAFNGAILWSLEIPDLRRVNIPRDSGNWCADEDRVYAAVGAFLWVIDAASGEMLHTIEPPGSGEADLDWGYIATTDGYLVGTSVDSGGIYEEFWDKPSWYDGINDTAASKVCGRSLMVYDKKYGDLCWKREMDAILHSTITVHRDKLYFVEVEDASLREQSVGRLTDSKIWSKASVVCLDLKTGEEQWKVKAPSASQLEVIAFGVADDEQFILETSSAGKFHLSSFDASTGSLRWSQSPKWSEDNHGGHMQHAVLMNGNIFLQPSILDATTGDIIKTDTLGKRRGCATPIGAGGSIIYRGGSGPVTLWSLDQENTSEFARLRPSCWLSTIPAHGMLYSPEAGGGCSCGGWMECSIGFAPAIHRQPATSK